MSRTSIGLLLFFLAPLLGSGQAFPGLFCGEAVVTCYSGNRVSNNPNGIVLAIWDIRDRSSVTPSTSDVSGSFSHYEDPRWIADTLGEIFGVTTDPDLNIYVAATTIYKGNYFGAPSLGNTGGEVHRIDALTGDVSLLVRLPNTGQGLGNLSFATAQDGTRLLFVTNWENGYIYRINLDTYNGDPNDPSNYSFFDPFGLDDGLPGYAPVGQLTWGIDYNPMTNRLYFGRWMQNAGNVGFPNNCTACGSWGIVELGTGPNEIWSVGLTNDGDFTGTALQEFCLDQVHSSVSGSPQISNPVSDISFSQSGDRMLITERSMCCPDESGAHRARVRELINVAGTCGGWSDSGKTFFIGTQTSTNGNNSSGGIDYGYSSFDPDSSEGAPPCDSMIWVMCDSPHGIYGLAGLSEQGNSSAQLQAYLINMASGIEKRLLGDVDIFKCGCPITEASIGDFVWEDLNQNGLQDGGEPGLPNIVVRLTGTTTNANTITQTTSTDASGNYLFDQLQPGNYKVQFIPPSGYVLSPTQVPGDSTIDSDPNAPSGITNSFVLAADNSITDIDAGLYRCQNCTDPGVITGDESLCGPGNDPAPITNSIAPNCPSGNFEYFWMRSKTSDPNGPWEAIKDATEAHYDPGPIAQTTHYRRCVRANGCYLVQESDYVTKTVDSEAVAQISAPANACVGDEIQFSASSNNPGATYQWDFGNKAAPSSSQQQNAKVIWDKYGLFKVKLQVQQNNCTSTAYHQIFIGNSPPNCGN